MSRELRTLRRQHKREEAKRLSKRLKDVGAVQFHREMAYPPSARCAVCSNRPAVRALVMAPFDEAQKRGMIPPDAAASPQALMGVIVPIKNSSGQADPFVRVSMTYACAQHVRELERALAKAPSWCIVEINRGPQGEKIITSG